MSRIRPLEVPNWMEQFPAFIKSCETTTNVLIGCPQEFSAHQSIRTSRANFRFYLPQCLGGWIDDSFSNCKSLDQFSTVIRLQPNWAETSGWVCFYLPCLGGLFSYCSQCFTPDGGWCWRRNARRTMTGLFQQIYSFPTRVGHLKMGFLSIFV